MKNNKNNAYTNKGERILIRLLCFILFGILCIPGMPFVKEIQAIQCDQVVLESYANTLTCPVCGAQNSDAAAPIQADWANNYIAPTCTKEGSIDFVCNSHAAPVVVATVALDKTDHIWESEDPTANIPKEYPNNDATCTTNATYNYHCTVCDGYYYGGEYANTALGHNYVANVTAATCTSEGYTTHTCSRCSDSYTDSKTAALGHNYKLTNTKAATCTAAGSESYTCSRCNHSYQKELAALGHNYVASVTAATCTTEGYTTHTCSRCNDSYTDSKTAALGHNFPDNWTVEKAAAVGVEGLRSKKCTRCGFKETEIIPMLSAEQDDDTSGDTVNSDTGEKTTDTTQKSDVNNDVNNNKDTSENTETDNDSGNIENSGNTEDEHNDISDSDDKNTEGSNGEEINEPEKENNIKPIIITAGSVGGVGILYLVLKGAGIIGRKKAIEAAAIKVAGAAVGNATEETTTKTAANIAEVTAEKITETITGAAAAKATKDLLKPSFKDRSISGCFKERDQDFVNLLKAQHFIELSESEFAIELSEDALDQDLVLISLNKGELNQLESFLEALEEKQKEAQKESEESENTKANDSSEASGEKEPTESKEAENTNIALILQDELAEEEADYFTQLKEEGKIAAFVKASDNACVKIVDLILPCFKPDLHSDEGLENIGMIADALSIPGISAIISVYTSGRDIKSTIEDADEDGLAFTDKATIISDIASILGLDKIASVAGLVEDVDDIKSALTSDVSANSTKSGKDAVEDIIDVAKDLL